jgi:hypothetical protein
MVDWGRIWRGNGVITVLFFVVGWIIYGSQPEVGSSANELVSFYDGDRTQILIAAVILGLNVLNLMWFAAALSTDLRDAGTGGWATAATASSAALGGILLLLITLNAALAYSIAGAGNDQITSALSDLSWVLIVLASFPAAMLVMSGSFGLWRAGLISNAWFSAGVAVVVLGVLRGTTWADDGFWAPDGAYSQFITPIIGLVWLTVVSGFLVVRGRSSVSSPDRTPVHAGAN